MSMQNWIRCRLVLDKTKVRNSRTQHAKVKAKMECSAKRLTQLFHIL